MQVSQVFATETSQRKIIKLQNNGEEFIIKLWGRETEMDMPPTGTEVAVTCIEVAEFRGQKQANSTTLTKVVVIIHLLC